MRKMDKFFITTGRKTNDIRTQKAMALAAECGIPFLTRAGESLPQLKQEHDCSIALLVKKNRICIDTPDGEIFFHPGMAQLRIKKLLAGGNDNMIDAMSLKQGMTVLDCTLGLAADALVSAFVCGHRVIGLEANQLLALVIKEGLRSSASGMTSLAKTAGNIEVINANHAGYLKNLPDQSVDVVYFDPMFRHPLTDSTGLQPLRCLADAAAVSEESIRQACRVAKHRVVLKENSKSCEFRRLGFSLLHGGRYSPIHYGIIDLQQQRRKNG